MKNSWEEENILLRLTYDEAAWLQEYIEDAIEAEKLDEDEIEKLAECEKIEHEYLNLEPELILSKLLEEMYWDRKRRKFVQEEASKKVVVEQKARTVSPKRRKKRSKPNF